MAVSAKKEEPKFKPGAYICVVDDGFAFFNKESYEYGDRVVVETEALAKKLLSAGDRFVPEAEFEKHDGKIIREVISASRNNKTVEDIIRSTDAEKAEMKAEYEAKIAELMAKIESDKK